METNWTMRLKAPRFWLTILVLSAFGFYFIINRHQFKPLLDINLYLLVVIALLNLGAITANGLFTKLIMKPFDKYISLLESFYVSLISSVGNFFAPVGAGFGFRAVYLKKKHDFAYSHYISTLAGNYIIVFLVNSLAGLVSLYLLRSKANNQFSVLVLTFVAVLAVGLTLSLVKIPKFSSKHRGWVGHLIRNLHIVSEGWQHIKSHKRLMFELIGITIFNLAITISITGLIIAALHLHTSLSALLLFAALSAMSTFINITPANLGIKEAIYLFSATVLGFSTSQILSIALIDRGALFLVLAVAWLLFGRRTLRRASAKTGLPRIH